MAPDSLVVSSPRATSMKILFYPLLLCTLTMAQDLPVPYKWILHSPALPECNDNIIVNKSSQIRINPAYPYQYVLTVQGQASDTLQFPFLPDGSVVALGESWIAMSDSKLFRSQDGKNWTVIPFQSPNEKPFILPEHPLVGDGTGIRVNGSYVLEDTVYRRLPKTYNGALKESLYEMGAYIYAGKTFVYGSSGIAIQNGETFKSYDNTSFGGVGLKEIRVLENDMWVVTDKNKVYHSSDNSKFVLSDLDGKSFEHYPILKAGKVFVTKMSSLQASPNQRQYLTSVDGIQWNLNSVDQDIRFLCVNSKGLAMVGDDSTTQSSDLIHWKKIMPKTQGLELSESGYGFNHALRFKEETYLGRDINDPDNSFSKYVKSQKSGSFANYQSSEEPFAWTMVRDGKIYGYTSRTLWSSTNLHPGTKIFSIDSFPDDPQGIQPLGEKGWMMDFENEELALSQDGVHFQKIQVPFAKDIRSKWDGKYVWINNRYDTLYRSLDGLKWEATPAQNRDVWRDLRYINGKTYAHNRYEVWTLDQQLKWSKIPHPNSDLEDSLRLAMNWDLKPLGIAGTSNEITILGENAIYRSSDGNRWVKTFYPNWTLNGKSGEIRLHNSGGHYFVTNSHSTYLLEGIPMDEYLANQKSKKTPTTKSAKK
jgi:hypothetical protein